MKNSMPGMGMGLAFDGLDQPPEDQLQSWLDDSTSEAPSAFISVEDSWKDPSPVAPPRATARIAHANGNDARRDPCQK